MENIMIVLSEDGKTACETVVATAKKVEDVGLLLLDMIQNEVIDLGCLGSCPRDGVGREVPLSDFDGVVANKYTCDGADCIFVFDKAAKQLRMDRNCMTLWQLNMDTQWSVAQMVLRLGETLFISINTDSNTLFFDEAVLTAMDINKSPSILAVRAGYRLHARHIIEATTSGDELLNMVLSGPKAYHVGWRKRKDEIETYTYFQYLNTEGELPHWENLSSNFYLELWPVDGRNNKEPKGRKYIPYVSTYWGMVPIGVDAQGKQAPVPMRKGQALLNKWAVDNLEALKGYEDVATTVIKAEFAMRKGKAGREAFNQYVADIESMMKAAKPVQGFSMEDIKEYLTRIR